VPSTFPGEGYANLYNEDYKPKLFYDACVAIWLSRQVSKSIGENADQRRDLRPRR
jgi:hypothetical protein